MAAKKPKKPSTSVPAKNTGGMTSYGSRYGRPGDANGTTWTMTPKQWQDLNGASRNRVPGGKKKK